MKITGAISSFIFAMALAFPAFAGGDGEDVQLSEVPEQVRASIERETQGGVIEDIERKTKDDGTVYYKVEFERNDQEFELKLDADGEVVKKERD